MIKKIAFTALLVMVLSASAGSVAFALGEPAGSCAPGFTLAMAMDHDVHHHPHVGSDTDFNEDGFICMRHVTPDESIHVHVDNFLP